MSKCICTLEPKAIWENFYKLTQVPRPSNHEEKAREFVMNWAKENGIHAEMDEANNILLSKPATPGMENRKVTWIWFLKKMKTNNTTSPKTLLKHISTENG